MRFAAAATAAAAVIALGACGRSPASTGAAPSGSGSPSASATATATAATTGPALSAASPPSDDAGAATGPHGKLVAAKSIGHTSVVLKLTFDDGVAAFKPRSRVGGDRYMGEIAAYRLATALHLPNVPPAYARSFDAAALKTIAPEATFAEIVADADAGVVRGALIPWIAHLEFPALHERAERARWEPWLTGAAAPTTDDDRALASTIAAMVMFDFVTGNWDRWSGGNVGRDGANGALLFIDNDGAFFDPVPAKPFAPEKALFEETRRFPRAFVGSLRALDDASFEASLARDETGAPLLTPAKVRAAAERRRRVLDVIAARVRADGEEKTLSLP